MRFDVVQPSNIVSKSLEDIGVVAVHMMRSNPPKTGETAVKNDGFYILREQYPPTCVLCAIIADLICCTTIFVVSSFVLKKRIAYCVSKHTKDVPDEEEVSLHLMLLSINIRSNVPT